MAEQEGFEAEAAAAQVVDGIGAGATQIAHGFVGGFRDIDGGQFAGAQEPGDGAGVAFIGFKGRAGLFGDEGGSGDEAGDLELLEAAGDAEAAGAGFVGDLQAGAGMSFADAAQGDFQAAQIMGDGAEVAELALGTRFSDSDSDGVFVDIETEIECNDFHGVVVSSHSVNESERIPRRVRGRSCGSAHPGNPRYQ